jgi:hypothetical protein
VRTSIDYVASPELRARAEADAYAVGLFVGYLLTGMLPTLDGALASLSSDTYHLAADEVALGRGVLESHLTTMASGLCPPLTIAVDVLAWLRATHPELIEGGGVPVTLDLVAAPFLGRSPRVSRAFGAKLARVEAALRDAYLEEMLTLPASEQPTFVAWHGVRGVGGYREGAGYHGKGRAIDINYSRNGYAACATHTARGLVYGGESAGAKLPGVRRAFIAACGRACAAAGVLCDLSARREGESTASVWDRWHVVSEAVRAYLAPYFPAVDDLDAGEADTLPGVTIPAQVMADYEALRVPLVVGQPVARPRLTRNPAKGLMDLRRAVVVALCDVGGMRWGGCDFGAGSFERPDALRRRARIPSGAI